MSIFKYGFTQTALLRRYSGINTYGDVQYSAPEAIMCRIEHKRQEVIGKDGVKAISDAVLYTETEMQALDQVEFDGRIWVASTVVPIRTLSGDIDHWEVTL